jgi:excisionase family DNA binding protein
MATTETRRPALMTIPEVARTLRVSPQTVYRKIAHNEIPAVKLAGGRSGPAPCDHERARRMDRHEEAALSRIPQWARDDDGGPSLVEASQGTQERLQRDAALEKLHTRATGALPLDRDRAASELTDEQRVLRAARPRTRRWRALAKIDDEIDAIQHRHADALARVTEAELALADAPRVDADSLASWLAGGEKGVRPDATLPERRRELDASKRLVDALVVELDRKLAQRVEYVQRNRERMADDARHDRERATERLQHAIAELAEARATAVNAVGVEVWVLAYPGDEVNASRLRTELMRGGRTSTAVPDIGTIVTAAAVHAWLADDGAWLGQVVDAEQAKRTAPDDIRDAAHWLQTDAGQAALERERQRVLEASLPKDSREAGWS